MYGRVIQLYMYIYLSFFRFFSHIAEFFFLMTLGLHCCSRAFSSCGEKWLLSAVVCGLLFAVAPLMVEHRLQAHRLQ